MSGAVLDNDPRLRTIVDALPSAVAYYDNERVCRFANAGYLALFTAPQTIVGSRQSTSTSGLRRLGAARRRPWSDRIDGARSPTLSSLPRGHRYFDVRLMPDSADGAVRGFTITLADLTPQQRVDENPRLLQRGNRHPRVRR